MRFRFISLFVLAFVFLVGFSSAAGNFTSTWNTSKTSDGSSNSTSIKLPLENGGDYDFVIFWGDGNSSVVTEWNSTNATHDYGVSGVYMINVVGKLKGLGLIMVVIGEN